MCKNQRLEFNARTTDVEGNKDYNFKQISNMIKRYQEIRGAIEITSSRYERVGGKGARNGKEELLCTIIDIDQALIHLTPRQRTIIQMVEKGYLYDEICGLLGVSINTVKFHVRHGISSIVNYLNL